MSSKAKRIRLESSRQLRSRVTKIEQLCDDVLVEIFSYLSAEELKGAALVSKKWNEVIGSSAVAMKKFSLKLKEIELIGQQFNSSRNYQDIELKMLTTRKPTSNQKSLGNLGRLFALSQVKYFKVFAYNPLMNPKNSFTVCFNNPWQAFSIDAMKLTSALKQMKLLQELFIESPNGFSGSFTSTMDLPKLTKLTVKSSDMTIFKWLSASNVTEIDLKHRSSNKTVNVEHLASFLKLCKQITTLKLNSSVIEELFENGKWKDFNLKLSELHINLNRSPDATWIREFLISQTPSLTSLRIEGVSVDLSSSEMNSIAETLSRLKNLKFLFLETSLDLDAIFLKTLPDLEELTLGYVNDINDIARFNRKLKYLKIEVAGNSLATGLVFSELKHFYAGIEQRYYLQVITSSPKIETIEFSLSNESNDRLLQSQIICVVMLQPTLRHLKLEYHGNKWTIEHLEEMYGFITRIYGRLKSLSLSKRVGPGWRSLEFLLPENRSEWNAEEQKKRLIETFSNN